MTQEIIHSIVLIIAIALSFILVRTNLIQYDLQIGAILFIIFFISKRLIPNRSKSRLIESVIFTLIILIVINSTGGVNSPFFFFIYFLLFSLSLLLEPIISITSTLTLIIFFLLSLPQNQSLSSLLPIFSLAFLTPFALFMGQEYVRIRQLTDKDQKFHEDTFLFLSLILKNHLKSIKSALENFLGDQQLQQIKKHSQQMEKLIEKFENDSVAK